MKNKWLTFVSANALPTVGDIYASVLNLGFKSVDLLDSVENGKIEASCLHCDRSVHALCWWIPSRDEHAMELMDRSITRVRGFPPTDSTKLVPEHLNESTFLVCTCHGDVMDPCDCDYRFHISFGALGQFMSYVDDRGFADDVMKYLEFDPA